MPPSLLRSDSYEDSEYSEDLAQSTEELVWPPGVQPYLPERRESQPQGRLPDAFFNLDRANAYPAAVQLPRLGLEVARLRRSHSTTALGSPRPAPPAISTPDTRAHRLGLDSHGHVVASQVKASATALIDAFSDKVDVSGCISRLNTYVATFANTYPDRALGQPRADNTPSDLARAQAYLAADTLNALSDKANAHFHLCSNKGEHPGVTMRTLCAIVWHCAESFCDTAQGIDIDKARVILREAVVRALAEFTLDSLYTDGFRCTIAQLALLMRALQGWYPQVRIDLVAPSQREVMQPSTANEFVLIFCYGLEVISRSAPPDNHTLVQKAVDAVTQVTNLYEGRPDQARVVQDVVAQMQAWYQMTYKLTWVWPAA